MRFKASVAEPACRTTSVGHPPAMWLGPSLITTWIYVLLPVMRCYTSVLRSIALPLKACSPQPIVETDGLESIPLGQLLLISFAVVLLIFKFAPCIN